MASDHDQTGRPAAPRATHVPDSGRINPAPPVIRTFCIDGYPEFDNGRGMTYQKQETGSPRRASAKPWEWHICHDRNQSGA